MPLHTNDVTVIDILRHGQCEGGEIYRGSTDVALTSLGWQQMSNSLEPLLFDGKPTWHKIVSSPLRRCREFAELKSNQWNLPLDIQKDFREMSFGDWEGQLTKDIYLQNPEFVESFYHDPENFYPPNSEHIVDVQNRLKFAWLQLVEEHKGQHILVVKHGAVMRILLLWLLNLSFTQFRVFEIPYAGLIRLKVAHQPNGDRVLFSGFNRIDVLER